MFSMLFPVPGWHWFERGSELFSAEAVMPHVAYFLLLNVAVLASCVPCWVLDENSALRSAAEKLGALVTACGVLVPCRDILMQPHASYPTTAATLLLLAAATTATFTALTRDLTSNTEAPDPRTTLHCRLLNFAALAFFCGSVPGIPYLIVDTIAYEMFWEELSTFRRILACTGAMVYGIAVAMGVSPPFTTIDLAMWVWLEAAYVAPLLPVHSLNLLLTPPMFIMKEYALGPISTNLTANLPYWHMAENLFNTQT